MKARRLRQRQAPAAAVHALTSAGQPELLARVLASRGIASAQDLETGLERLLKPDMLKGLSEAVDLLCRALLERQRICIIADYDCDGATACAIGLRGLGALGARIDYLVPNRFEHGYGLQPSIVDLALQHPRLGRPELLITVDNGIASIAGVEAAHAAGLKVLVTDHHLAGAQLPRADAILNPNQGDCPFPSKALAGCGVMFYLLIALRARLRQWPGTEPADEALRAGAHRLRLDALLDLVALGTVADLVPLDRNNRILVEQGLRRIRQMQMQPGLRALLRVSGRDPRRLQASDLGFTLGPRINAAGRLEDMSLGIECLISDDEAACEAIAQRLETINRDRRSIEADTRAAALAQLPVIDTNPADEEPGHVAFDAAWHEGVIGLVAGRLKDRLQTPCIVFARAQTPAGQAPRLKGSGRSIPGVHLRDCLDWVEKQAPGLMIAFGGHAMAAGLSLAEQDLGRFTALFRRALRVIAPASAFDVFIEHDGALDPSDLTLSLCRQLEAVPWGQGFPPPLLLGQFEVQRQRLVGERHLALQLTMPGLPGQVRGIFFNHAASLPPTLRCLYRLSENQYQGLSELQIQIEHLVDDQGQALPAQD